MRTNTLFCNAKIETAPSQLETKTVHVLHFRVKGRVCHTTQVLSCDPFFTGTHKLGEGVSGWGQGKALVYQARVGLLCP